MFTALENEIVHILQANLSPDPVPDERIVNGPPIRRHLVSFPR